MLFAAIPTGGTLQAQVGEVIDVRYFDAHALPEPLIWWHRQRIQDALHGFGGSVAWRQNVTWPFDAQTTHETIYQRRDQAGLPRQELYFRFFGQHDVEDETLEVGGTEIPPM